MFRANSVRNGNIYHYNNLLAIAKDKNYQIVIDNKGIMRL